LGAPLPNPVVDGKTKVRRSPATGIIFNDSAGNERGGIGMLDDGSMNLCFDDAKTERNCLFFMPKFGNGIGFQRCERREQGTAVPRYERRSASSLAG
jgi:hypothetical protein